MRTMKSESDKLERIKYGVLPCACGCGQSVEASKALRGLDYIFKHGGPRGSCRRRFMHWAGEHGVHDDRLQFLFRWYRAVVFVAWTSKHGQLYQSALRTRTIEKSRSIEHDEFPADIPPWWRDFAYAPQLETYSGAGVPDGHVFTHFAFLHLNESDHQSVEPDELVEVVSPAREHHLYG